MLGSRWRLPLEAGGSAPFTRIDWLLFGGVILVAALLRLPALDTIPPGLWRDEAGYALAAQDIQRGLLKVYWGDKEPLFPYVLAGVFAALGPSVETVRGTAALFGVGTVGLTFLLGRLLLGRWGGSVAAIGLATTFWTLDLNRIGFRVNTMPFFLTLAFWLLWRGLIRGGRGNWLGAGIALGVTPYTYLAARMAPVAVALFFGWLLLVDRRRVAADRSGWALLAGGMILTALPLLIYFVVEPASFLDRAKQLSPFSGAASPAEIAVIAARGVWDTVGMFFWRGDSEPRHNLPGRPVLDLASGALFALGGAICIVRFRERAAAFLLLWLAMLLLPSALAVDNPHALRTLGAAPAVFLLVALGASTLGMALTSLLRRPAVAPTLAAAWLVIAGALTVRDYFLVWAASPLTAQFFEAEVTAAARLLRDAPPGTLAYASAPFVPHPTVEFLAPARAPLWFDGGEGVVFRHDRGPNGTVYALPGSNERARSTLQSAVGDAVITPGPAGADGRPRAWLVFLPPTAPIVVPRLPQPAAFIAGGVVEVTSRSDIPPAIAPGGRVEVAIAWSPRGPTVQPDLAFFVHLLDATGQLRGQHDAVTYPSWQWQGGERVISWFSLPVAPDAPPGRYRLIAGVYPRATLQRLPWTAAGPAGEQPVGDTIELGITKIAPPPPPPPERWLGVALGGRIALDGVDLPPGGCALESARPPCDLTIALHWRALTVQPDDVQVFVHLAGRDDRPVVQADGAPRGGTYPTSLWSPGERVLDQRALQLPAGLPPGDYRLLVGLYRLEGGARLATPWGAESIEIATVRVG
ncbi:MAG: glycosyltransferase family 39 protein [Chloroflexota bacterium]|nr:glycosyltransferase family 39 protein [Dehalococcoidia bacterium]MDW8254090.1 glycosyltransferase family 39 protein [Chloroflexota bacterium]